MSTRVIVIGAGIIGAATALHLSREGMLVTLCDAGEPGGEQAASYGNGGWISPASIIPMSMPGLWKQVPGFLLDKTSPLTLDWKSLPQLTPWLIRFLLSGATKSRASKIASNLSWLLHDSPSRHQALAASIGQSDLIKQNGLIYVYPDRSHFEEENFSWQLRRANGVNFVEWDEETLRGRIPAVGEQYRYAVHATDGAHCLNTGAYVHHIVEAAKNAGTTHVRENVVKLQSSSQSVTATLSSGAQSDADYVVVAAGAHSNKVLQSLSTYVPMTSERGYHVTIPGDDIPFDTPIMPSTGKMANTPTELGLRLAGQVELATLEKEPNWDRSKVLLNHAVKTYPYLSQRDLSDAKLWMGHRPSTADCLPAIGAFKRHPRVMAAFGHAHTGIAAAPKTAEIVAKAIRGEASSEAKAFSPQRFE